MFKSGEMVAEHVTLPGDNEIRDDQIQPNGVDLTINDIVGLEGGAIIGDEEYTKQDRYSVLQEDMGFYPLEGGNYVVLYNEILEVPNDHVGFVFPRSRLLRCGCHLTTAVWDTGYRGRGEGALFAPDKVIIYDNIRIGQFTLCRASNLQEYDGSHQHERLEESEDGRNNQKLSEVDP